MGSGVGNIRETGSPEEMGRFPVGIWEGKHLETMNTFLQKGTDFAIKPAEIPFCLCLWLALNLRPCPAGNNPGSPLCRGESGSRNAGGSGVLGFYQSLVPPTHTHPHNPLQDFRTASGWKILLTKHSLDPAQLQPSHRDTGRNLYYPSTTSQPLHLRQ